MANRQPIFQSDSATALAARTLRAVLVSVVIYAVLFFAIEIPFFAVRKLSGSMLFLWVLLGALLSALFLRRGNVRVASWIFLSAAWSFSTILTILTGGISSQALLGCLPFIIVAAFTLGRIVAWACTGFFVMLAFALALLENAGVHLPKHFPAPPISTWIVMLFFVATAIIPIFEVLQTLNETLEKQHRQNEDFRLQEHRLRESEQRLRFAQKVANIGTFDWNIGTDVNTWTPELEAMHGLPPGGFPHTQTAWEKLLHPDDRPKATQLVKDSFETEAPTEGEWRVVWPDGTVRWLAARWQVFKSVAGEPLHLMGVNIDVTDSKQMEETLRNSEERYRLAIKATNDAIWDIDLKTGIVSWNETYSMLYGRPPETSDSWEWWINSIHPEDREHTVGDLRAAISSRASSWTSEYRLRRFDGEWAHIYDRAYIARDASGSARRVIGAMQDLTERKRSEAALRESEERFRRVFEEGPLGLAIVGRDYRFQKVNSALCQLVGYPEAELAQLSFADITYPDDLQADVELAERLFRREIPFYRMQKRYVKKSGEIIWINLTASMILGPGGEPLHGIAMVEDITEIKRTQEETLARHKLESLGTLASGIAHDFNNLLGAVQVQAEMALAELNVGSSCEEELKTIRGVAMRGAEIVRQLMIYAGKESVAAGPVDLSKIVEEMLALLKVSVSKHAVVRADLGNDLPAVAAGSAQIRQIVLNLITNASEAIGNRDGVIRVATRHMTLGAESDAAVSEGLPKGEYLQLEVSDTGCGMPLEMQAKVFDPFFTTKPTGHGLGLAVVQGIVRGLGGTIHLASEPGKGTTVRILLPCAEPRATVASGTSPRAERAMRTSAETRILVVEDEAPLRQAVVKMLRRKGFIVTEVSEGFAALEAIRAYKGQIDVLLLDLTLPGAPSREIFEEARRQNPDIRVIIASAYGKDVASATLQAKVDCFLQKPFRLDDLVALVREETL
jgi:PAS domain S-box-containing protein